MTIRFHEKLGKFLEDLLVKFAFGIHVMNRVHVLTARGSKVTMTTLLSAVKLLKS